jgi:hypothetical protein
VLVAMGERYREPVVFEEAIAVFAAALEERRRESVPLLWATSSANQALPMMRLAERRNDAALAKQALTQIAVAIEAMRSAGFAANAKHLEARLIKAGALVEALNKA